MSTDRSAGSSSKTPLETPSLSSSLLLLCCFTLLNCVVYFFFRVTHHEKPPKVKTVDCGVTPNAWTVYGVFNVVFGRFGNGKCFL
ncbi:transmembrane protein, putative [Medicago truncatula]|uniref:Transmembrane protein, putative n=1 Tax=Medicago truncatula TaxID=3880 RepID=A0A072VGW8_MEDTR|nr:transmembrane protein, putative [Medicago truncatula]